MNQRRFLITLIILLVLVLFIYGCQSTPEASQINTLETVVQSNSTTQEEIIPTATTEIILPTSTPFVDISKIRFGVGGFEFVNPNKGGPISSVAFSPDNNFLAMAGNGHISIIKTINLTIPYILEGHTDLVIGLDWTPDGSVLVSASQDDNVILWETEKFTQLEVLTTGSVSSIDVSPDGSNLVVGSETGGLSIWDIMTGNLVMEFLSPNGSKINSVKYSPEGNMIASGDEFGYVYIWDSDLGELITSVEEFGADLSVIYSVDWSFDGNFLATGHENGNVFILTTTGWSIYRSISTQTDWVSSVNWMPGQLVLAVTGRNGSNIWNTESGEEITGFGGGNDYLCADWSPNGRYFAQGSGGFLYESNAQTPYIIREEAVGGFGFLWVRIDNQ